MESSGRPSAETLGDEYYAQVAQQNWSGKKRITRVQQDVVKELWDNLEKGSFATGSLVVLENTQALEKYLWPGFNDDSSNIHALLLVLLINVKRRENLPSWDLFADRPVEFSALFRRILSLVLDTNLSSRVRTHLLVAVIGAFQSLDSGLIRKECAPLVSISIWRNLHSENARGQILDKNPQFKKAWKAAVKRLDMADNAAKARARFDWSWLYTLLLDFLNILYTASRHTADHLTYCERFMEFLADLQSQFPTRRYVNTLLRDLNILVAVKQSPLYRDETSSLLRDFWSLLRHFTSFPIDDHTGRELSTQEFSAVHHANLALLQRTALRHHKEKLTLLALANYGSLDQREELKPHLEVLDHSEIRGLAVDLGFRTQYPNSASVSLDRTFLLEILIFAYEKQPTYQDVIQETNVLPTETSLYEAAFLRNESYNGSRPLAIPKLNLQYLTTGDFLWRSFILFRCEAFYEIRKDLEDTVKRMQPKKDFSTGAVRFSGSSRMALAIPKPAIIEVVPAKVGHNVPAQVRAEITLDVSRVNENVRRDWESLRSDDVVFLLAVEAPEPSRTDGSDSNGIAPDQAPFRYLRAAQIVQVQDDKGRSLRMQSNQNNGYHSRPRQRRLIVKLDAAAYQQDAANVKQGKTDVYEHLNMIVRRRSRENNFKAMLGSIQRLILSDVQLPPWLQDVFLGLGDPAGATYKKMSNALKKIDYRDTFLNWQHLLESFPDKSVEADGPQGEPYEPPYVLSTAETNTEQQPKTSRKRRHEEVEGAQPKQSIVVSTYKRPNPGPYPTDKPKINTVPFTPTQVESITSGIQPGLTIILGPPGTGKTDVATQIVNNIYHNFPEERILLVAHSNQALNQLFQKIVALDIDERHLLRLGHGEGELQLDTDASYSKHGRVESFLENGSRYLTEVTRLAASLNAPGAHGNSCETANYFNQVYVKPTWNAYWDSVQDIGISVEQMMEKFPLYSFFDNAPQPLFPSNSSREAILDVAAGCYRHIEKIFSELEDIRPFEVLRNAREKTNYLLVKEARIIAMTSTHAAIRRQDIVNLGFEYDNVIMEEAAQITEIENFIPLVLQNSKNGVSPLKRVVMCGDHLQNSPIVQNLAFRQYANLEQSMFLRLVRLGVPKITLDKQGRARRDIAELYKWRYPELGSLPIVDQATEYQTANAGLRYDYQFIDVPDYKGKGEMEPTPHFIQNLGEAEYAVALFMFMRLLGYPASTISILTTYAGQRSLIRDVLNHRCAKNRLFGLPKIVTTVDKYQGEQNDCKHESHPDIVY